MATDTKEAQLGDRVVTKDRISRGIVIVISDFLYGCRRLGIQPEAQKDGKPVETIWVDAPQVTILKHGVITSLSTLAKAARRHGPRDDVQRAPDARRR